MIFDSKGNIFICHKLQSTFKSLTQFIVLNPDYISFNNMIKQEQQTTGQIIYKRRLINRFTFKDD